MKSILLSVVLVLGTLAANAEIDSRYFEIKSIKTREVQGAPAMSLAGMSAIGTAACQKRLQTADQSLNPIDQIDIIVDKIINVGKKIWNVVQAGKPVLNLKTDIATALPQGASCWQDLQMWKMPESRVYEATFENAFGSEVVKMSYRVVWLPGGSVNGVGQYVGYATMVPVDMQVSWGFSLNAEASVPTVFNMGTKAAPIGAAQLTMQYRVESPLATIEQAQAFVVNGAGEYRQLD